LKPHGSKLQSATAITATNNSFGDIFHGNTTAIVDESSMFFPQYNGKTSSLESQDEVLPKNK
jgi:hypothetical protein